ncbi:MAG: TonB-dependent receptor domain-containing protein, partial [Planctomycetota bacterium]
ATGDIKLWGAELEGVYKTEKVTVRFSHGYTKLINYWIPDMTEQVPYSAEPYGYGNDLASWSNHISKLYTRYKIDPKWSLDGSLRLYWGFPGAEDWSDYNNSLIESTGEAESYTLADPGYSKAWRPSVFVNLGLEYNPTKNLTIRLDANNILGWIDKDLNKRNFHLRMSEYRSEAPAIGFTLRYTF